MESSRREIMVVRTRTDLRLPKLDQQRQFLQADDVSRHQSANPKSVHGGFDSNGIATTMWCKFRFIHVLSLLCT